MTDYIHSEGADASNYSSADYANNFFTYAVDGQHEAYTSPVLPALSTMQAQP